MKKFKVGDLVRVKLNACISSDGRKMQGKLGRIIRINSVTSRFNSDMILTDYAVLDTEDELYGYETTGIWFQELELIERAYKEIKEFGISKFMRELCQK